MEVTQHQGEHRDAEGLQSVERNDFPEVVPGQHFGTRRNSEMGPEAYTSTHQQDQQQSLLGKSDKKSGAYVGAEEGDYFHGQQPLPSPGPPQYAGHEKTLESQEKPKERRCCGLTRKVFILVIVVALLVILGVALGVGLGIGLSGNSDSDSSNGNSSNSAPYAAMNKTGVALLSPSESSTLYAYYVDQSGTIVETAYTNGAWSQNNTALPSTTMNVTSLGKGSNSPIAALSYSLQGNTYRALFFFDSNGHVLTTNTTGTNPWPAPYEPTFAGGEIVASQPNTMSLAAVAGSSSDELDGFRVYLGSNAGEIQEIGMDFSDGIWNKWASFPNTDANGGVASVIVNNENHLYLRSSAGQLQQWTWDYNLQYNPEIGNTSWTVAANPTSTNDGVAEGGSIAVATDGQSTDYIFYQSVRGQTVQTTYSGSGTTIPVPSDNVQSIQAAPVGYSLAATYVNGGAVVMNQNSTSATELLFSTVSRNGQSEGYSTQTGGTSS